MWRGLGYCLLQEGRKRCCKKMDVFLIPLFCIHYIPWPFVICSKFLKMVAKYTRPKAQFSRLPGEDKSLFQSDNNGTEFDMGQSTVRLKKRLLISTICNAISLLLFIGIGVARLHDSRQLNGNLRKCSSYSTCHQHPLPELLLKLYRSYSRPARP